MSLKILQRKKKMLGPPYSQEFLTSMVARAITRAGTPDGMESYVEAMTVIDEDIEYFRKRAWQEKRKAILVRVLLALYFIYVGVSISSLFN